MLSFEQIKHRKIFQWTVAYLAGAWLLMQVAQWLAAVYSWPVAFLRFMPVILAAGLLVVLVLAWYQGEAGRQRMSGGELAILAGILLLAGIGVSLVRPKPAATAKPVVEQGSIAVLPFTDMSAAKDQAYFSDGLSEELLNMLAQVPQLRVAARTSSFSFRDKSVAIDSVARALHVEYVLEGSVRTAGQQVRITAQLIKAADGFHVWSDAYDRTLQDVFAVQEEISKAIVDALRLRISSGTIPVAQADSTDPETHALVLRGRYALAQRGESNIRNAVVLMQQAVARDSGYAPAWTGLAYAQWYMAYRRYGPVSGYKQAAASARHGLQLNPNDADAYVTLARVADVYEWNFKQADEYFARARKLRPGLSDAYVLHSWLQMRLGRPQESLETARRGTVLDPVSAAAHNTLGSMYSYAGDYPHAIDAYRAALALQREDAVIKANLSLTFGSSGQVDSAIYYAESARQNGPNDPFVFASLGYAYGRAGNTAKAEEMLRKTKQAEVTSPYNAAMVYAGLQRWDDAFRELERAVTEHDDLVPDVGVDDVFKPVRGDPRMKALVKRIGLD